MNDQTVTWLLPIKNAMPFLREALAAIAAQTHTNHQVLAWDNGSTDGSVDELRRWIGPRLAGTLITDRPLPLGACLAAMTHVARTTWCARVDGDDICHPDRLRLQLARAIQHPRTILVGSQMAFMDQSGQPMQPLWKRPVDDTDIRWRLRFSNVINHPTVLFKRAAVLAAGGYRSVAPEDYDLWLRMIPHGRMINLDAPLVRYRCWPSTFQQQHGVDLGAMNRKLLEEHQSLLWPGLSDVQRRRLRELLDHEMPGAIAPITLGDLSLLRSAAHAAGRAVGEAPNYFTRSAQFQQQKKDLFFRYLKQIRGLNVLRSLLPGTHNTSAEHHSERPAA